MKKWLPLILTAVMALWFVSKLRAPKDADFAYSQFGKLPIVYHGRVKPMDSLARNSLLQLREKQSLNLEPWKAWYEKPKIIPAIEWLAEVMMNPAVADTWPAFRVDNLELKAMLKLPEKDKELKQDGKHYSWNQIEPLFGALRGEVERIDKIEAGRRNAYERAAMKLQERLMIYFRLKNTLQPQESELLTEVASLKQILPAEPAAFPPLKRVVDEYLRVQKSDRENPNRASQEEVARLQAAVAEFLTVAKTTQEGKPYGQDVLEPLVRKIDRYSFIVRLGTPLLVPPQNPQHAREDWMRVAEALLNAMRDGRIEPALNVYGSMAAAFRAKNVAAFNEQVGRFYSSLAPSLPTEVRKARAEVFFNHMQPFYKAMVFYVMAGLLAAVFWFNLSETFRRSAVWLVGLAFVIHTTGLIFRMALEGRPPVTNLYSSAIFIGWGAVVLGLILERFYRNGIGAVAAASLSFITLIIAHHLSLEGDTMIMMRAVLDTNFWLATHVVVVTLGYASTFVAGFLAIIYIIRGVFTKTLDEGTSKSLSRMIYGIVCFATLFSFVGTVLGGIWADQSWGRFWGWDPKENGALIIVLWNALILHLRWGGMIRERGLVNCAIVGNIVTSWSWFGVNMLGIGLHSYGFMDAAFKWLMLFVGSQLALIAIGSLPLSVWKSFQDRLPPSGGESATSGTVASAAH